MTWREQCGEYGRAARRPLFIFVAPVLLVSAAILLYATHRGLTVGRLLRDPQHYFGGHPMYGFFSFIGVLFWCVGAAVSAFAFRYRARRLPRGEAAFLLASAVLTVVLMLDDLFLLHEVVLPRLSFRQRYTYGAYVLATLGYLWGFRRVILRTNVLLLLGALGLFAVSLGIDVLWADAGNPLEVLLEDGAKFAGIVCWCAYLWTTAGAALDRPPTDRNRQDVPR